MKKPKQLRKFRVWTEQINQMVWDVTAETEMEAKEKALRQWMKEIRPSVGYIQPA